MKTYEDILRTDTFWITTIQSDLYDAVEQYLKENQMTRTQFAEQLGVSKGYLSQVLNGDFNHRLSKLVELSLAIGKVPVLEFENIDEVVSKRKKGLQRAKARYVKPSVLKISGDPPGVVELKSTKSQTIRLDLDQGTFQIPAQTASSFKLRNAKKEGRQSA